MNTTTRLKNRYTQLASLILSLLLTSPVIATEVVITTVNNVTTFSDGLTVYRPVKTRPVIKQVPIRKPIINTDSRLQRDGQTSRIKQPLAKNQYVLPVSSIVQSNFNHVYPLPLSPHYDSSHNYRSKPFYFIPKFERRLFITPYNLQPIRHTSPDQPGRNRLFDRAGLQKANFQRRRLSQNAGNR